MASCKQAAAPGPTYLSALWWEATDRGPYHTPSLLWIPAEGPIPPPLQDCIPEDTTILRRLDSTQEL